MQYSKQGKCFISQRLTAVLIDFFLRHKTLYIIKGPQEMAKKIKDYAYKLVKQRNDLIYRIYIYDCKPSKNSFVYPKQKI